jgi:hypothetical protein
MKRIGFKEMMDYDFVWIVREREEISLRRSYSNQEENPPNLKEFINLL